MKVRVSTGQNYRWDVTMLGGIKSPVVVTKENLCGYIIYVLVYCMIGVINLWYILLGIMVPKYVPNTYSILKNSTFKRVCTVTTLFSPPNLNKFSKHFPWFPGVCKLTA